VKILFVCHRLPYPPNRGGKIRPFNMIRHLSQKHSVTVASLAHTEQEFNDGADLRNHCEEVIAEVLPSRQRWLQAFRALPTRTPSSVAYFWSSRLDKRIRQRCRDTRFDAIFVHCAFVAQYAADLQADFRVMDFGDIDSAKWAEYSQWKPFPTSRMYGFESTKLRRYERSIAQQFDHCTVTTQGERDELKTFRVSTPSTVIPNGVDLSYFSPVRNGNDTGAIVFLGRMDYFPNIDGVCYFAEKILPLIRQKVPGVEFRIVGSNPVRRVQELAKIPNTLVTGHVPDVRSHLQDAAMAIAPLRIARGTQNKILESMAMGIPVVATPEAAKGIQAVAGRDLLVGETPEIFAGHAIDLLQSASLRQSLSEAARKQVERAHLWPVSMDILDSVLAGASSDGLELEKILLTDVHI
jgi:sugar transferase (PEP-CTERM/EpsH1 system associated)